MWQHVKLTVRIRHTLECCWDVKKPTNKRGRCLCIINMVYRLRRKFEIVNIGVLNARGGCMCIAMCLGGGGDEINDPVDSSYSVKSFIDVCLR